MASTYPHGARPGRIGAGIGLLLMMIVILIGMSMYFGAFGGKSYMQTVVASKKHAIDTVQDISTGQLNQCIAIYKMNNNRLPQTAEELDAGPLLDPWKRPMTFAYKTEKGEGLEVIYVIWRSAGPDGAMNTPDDIVKEDRLPIQG